MHVIQKILKIIFPKPEIKGQENLKKNQYTILAANHLGVFGPIWLMLWADLELRPWITAEIMEKATCKKYLQKHFFQNELGWHPKISKLIATIIAPICLRIIKEIKGIPVYHGTKGIKETLTLSQKSLQAGSTLLIFPEIDPTGDTYQLRALQGGFIRIAMETCRNEGKTVIFYPVGISKKNKRIIIDKGIEYNCQKPYPEEKEKIISYLTEMISKNTDQRT